MYTIVGNERTYYQCTMHAFMWSPRQLNINQHRCINYMHAMMWSPNQVYQPTQVR